MNALLCRLLDRVVIRMATARMPKGESLSLNMEGARELLQRPDFFVNGEMLPSDWKMDGLHFAFTSPVRTPWEENNRVVGRLYRCRPDSSWRTKPTVVLLHGWNDFLGYHLRQPAIARRLNRGELNALTIELPYHFRRRPRQSGAVRNFFSRDILRSVEAVRQGLADVGVACNWLRDQGCPRIGLWGVSLGAWLGGLLMCQSSRIDCGLLVTPAARPDLMIEELPFCAPIRHGFRAMPGDTAKFNLAEHRPKTERSRILLVEGVSDLFVSKDTVEELWQAWGKPEIWRLPHGHISILSSTGVLNRLTDWVVKKIEER